MLSAFIYILLAIHILVSLLIIFVVLMQRPKSEGLGAAFGGGMTENLFGAQTTNVLANFTRWLGGIFFALTLTLSVLYAKVSGQHSTIQQNLIKSSAVAPAVPGASATPAAPSASGTAAVAAQLMSALAKAAASASPASATPAAPISSPAAMIAATPTATPAAVAPGASPAGH